ncbi:MAG: molybdenum cofactor biosynthesis protein B [Thermaerobacterales bacterium]
MTDERLPPPSVADHRRQASRFGAVKFAVITVSDTRSQDDDQSGPILIEGLQADGHTLIHYAVVPDEPQRIRSEVKELLNQDLDAILLNGGTGIAPRDRTFESLAPEFDRELPGFGELFRMLSFAEIGAAAMLSRAAAGVIGRRLIFCLPGSRHAVALALDRLIRPELGHMVFELNKS